MELPTTTTGNRYVLVFQEHLTKWPFVFPCPTRSQNVSHAKLLVKEVVPVFGVPEADHGTNLLSHLMMAVCASGGEKVGHNRLPPPPV